MSTGDKIKLLNNLLAMGSPFAGDFYCDAARGVSQAVKDAEAGGGSLNVADFVKNVLPIYDSTAQVELLEFGEGHFDPLFAIPTISQAVKRLSGFPRAILVIYGLDSTLKNPLTHRATKRRANEYSENIEFIEEYVSRYKTAFANLEILFV